MALAWQETLVGISDVAEMAGVTRAAASNWPRRYPDFPQPRVVAPSGALFDATEIERWLIVKGKIGGPIRPEVRLWKALDRLRKVWKPAEIIEFLAGCLVYLEAVPATSWYRSERATALGENEAWTVVRQLGPDTVAAALMEIGARLERENPVIDGVITGGLDRVPPPDGVLLVQILDDVVASGPGAGPKDVFYDEAFERLLRNDRSFATHRTPVSIAELLVRLAKPITGVVFDPAAGAGGLLQTITRFEGNSPTAVVGYETDPRLVHLARAGCYLHHVDARIECRDSLRMAGDLGVTADVVLLDPPLNQRDWGDTDLYLDNEIWSFGLPSPKSADFAWVQLAINALTPDGRAFVVLPAVAATAGGRAERIRRSLVDNNCIESVVFLHPRMGSEASIPLSVWVLRRPHSERSDWMDPPPDVLLVDATGHGQGDDVNLSYIAGIVSWGTAADLSLDPSVAVIVSAEQLGPDANLSYWFHQPFPPPPDLDATRTKVDDLHRDLEASAKKLSIHLEKLGAVLRRTR